MKLGGGTYTAKWYDPGTGAWEEPIKVIGDWRAEAPTADDWAVLLYRR